MWNFPTKSSSVPVLSLIVEGWVCFTLEVGDHDTSRLCGDGYMFVILLLYIYTDYTVCLGRPKRWPQQHNNILKIKWSTLSLFLFFFLISDILWRFILYHYHYFFFFFLVFVWRHYGKRPLAVGLKVSLLYPLYFRSTNSFPKAHWLSSRLLKITVLLCKH